MLTLRYKVLRVGLGRLPARPRRARASHPSSMSRRLAPSSPSIADPLSQTAIAAAPPVIGATFPSERRYRFMGDRARD
jgi:hypothetical protein